MGENVRVLQLKDPKIGPLLEAVEIGEKPTAVQLGNITQSARRLLQIWDQSTLCDGILCLRFETTDGLNAIAQIVVPGMKCWQISMKMPGGGI